ncbi:MAG TPA: helix-turn-helix domain-containing protein [Kofleriaceae bacterium]
MKGSDEQPPPRRGKTMASDTPTDDAPRTGDPTPPASESPASVGTNRRRKPQPHHRPAAIEFGVASDAMASLARAIAELVRVEVDARVRAALADVTRPDEYLSTSTAGKLAQVAPGTVRRWIREGKLIGHRAGRVVRVRRSELEQLLRDGAQCRMDDNESPEALALRDFG